MDVPLTRRHVLLYEFVEGDILELRTPHRPAHIEHIRAWQADGRILMSGALGDPPHGGMLIFAVEDPAEIAEFAEADPYVKAGLVADWRVEPWDVVS